MKVPLLDLRAQYATVASAVEAAVKRVLESGHYILGEDVAAFERELAAATGAPHARRGVERHRRAARSR